MQGLNHASHVNLFIVVLTSVKSMSLMDFPVFASKASTAGTGPIPIIVGSHPVELNTSIKVFPISCIFEYTHTGGLVNK